MTYTHSQRCVLKHPLRLTASAHSLICAGRMMSALLTCGKMKSNLSPAPEYLQYLALLDPTSCALCVQQAQLRQCWRGSEGSRSHDTTYELFCEASRLQQTVRADPSRERHFRGSLDCLCSCASIAVSPPLPLSTCCRLLMPPPCQDQSARPTKPNLAGSVRRRAASPVGERCAAGVREEGQPVFSHQ